MKNITIFLIILISTTACNSPEPAADPAPTIRTIETPASPSPESSLPPNASPTAVIPSAMADSPTLTPQTFLWVIDGGETRGDYYLIKMTADGRELWRTQFEQASDLGIDLRDGGVWTNQQIVDQNFESRLVKLDGDGTIVRQVQGYESGLFAVDPNDGSLWISLISIGDLVKLNEEGVVTARISGLGQPYALAVDSRDSSLWFVDGTRRKIIKFDHTGEQLVILDTIGFFSDSPQQIAINPGDGSVWHGGLENVFKLSAAGDILAQVSGFDSPIAVAIDANDGTVWVSDFSTTGSGAIVKLDPNGNELFRTDLGSPPLGVAAHPEDGSVWVAIEDGLIKLSPDGFVLTSQSTVHSPTAVMMATVLMPPSAVVSISETPTAEFEPDALPKPVTPTPVADTINTAEYCAAVESIALNDCETIALVFHRLDPNLLGKLVNEGCLWPRIICNEDGHIIHLDLSDYQLNNLPPEIGDVTHLQKLDLANNNLDKLPPEIAVLNELKILGLYGNNLTTLPPEIGQLTNLQKLSVDYNPLKTLPPEIGQLGNLQELHLWAVDLEVLPPEIGNLTNLEQLQISAKLDALPPEIGNLTNLTILDLPLNNLVTLPPEIGQLTNLASLILGSNQLSSLPPEVGNLLNLQMLELSHNNLTTLPPEIGNLVNLEGLILAYNNLSMLPPEIGNLSNLEFFCLYPMTLTLPSSVERLKEQTTCFSYEY